MDKKNTMLLTVIAVATLLVAVVGATFAYFSISANSTVTNSRIEATIEDVGVIAVNPGTMPSLNLKLVNFANAGQLQTWHSSSDGTPKDSDQEITVVKANVTGGGAGVTYACTGTLKVELTDDYENLKNHASEAVLTIAAVNPEESTDIKFGEESADGTSAIIDFSEYTAAKTYQLAFEVSDTNTTGKDKEILKADLAVQNTTNEQQDYLAGATLGAQITVSEVTCAPKKAA